MRTVSKHVYVAASRPVGIQMIGVTKRAIHAISLSSNCDRVANLTRNICVIILRSKAYIGILLQWKQLSSVGRRIARLGRGALLQFYSFVVGGSFIIVFPLASYGPH